jgi:hypothetical protein
MIPDTSWRRMPRRKVMISGIIFRPLQVCALRHRSGSLRLQLQGTSAVHSNTRAHARQARHVSPAFPTFVERHIYRYKRARVGDKNRATNPAKLRCSTQSAGHANARCQVEHVRPLDGELTCDSGG